MKKIALGTFFFSFFTLFSMYSHIVFAATPRTATKSAATPAAKTQAQAATPSPSPVNEDQATQNLKDRIDRVIEQRKEEVKGVVDQINGTKHAIVGEVQRVTEKTVTIKNKKGSQTFTMEPEIILARDNTRISIDDIAVGDWAMAMGYMDKDEFTLKRLVVSGKSLAPKQFTFHVGTIKSVSRTQVVLTSLKNEEHTYTITKTSQYQDAQGAALKREQVLKNAKAVIVGLNESNGQSLVIVRVIAPPQAAEANE